MWFFGSGMVHYGAKFRLKSMKQKVVSSDPPVDICVFKSFLCPEDLVVTRISLLPTATEILEITVDDGGPNHVRWVC